MKEKLPININILRWARESIGLSINDVANKINKEKEDILAWESGDASPTYSQLEKLAYQIYKRPVALFFFPDIPVEENPKTEFRTLPDTINESLPYELIKLYRKAKVFQLNLSSLYEGNKVINPNLLDRFSIDSSSNLVALAENIRDYFDISIEKQFSWQSKDLALKNWRLSLENKGIFIFKDAFHNDDYSGFCIYDDNFPIIYINNSMSISRQIFTIFHELCHLLFHSGGVYFRDQSIPYSFEKKYLFYEIKCNQFANEILVPSKYFNNEKLLVSENNFVNLSKKYCVSREVVLRNFLDRSLITEKYYNQMSTKWIEEAKLFKQKKSSGGDYYRTQKVYLGDTYINLAFSKYYQNKIPIEKLSDFLNIKIRNVSAFEHYALQ